MALFRHETSYGDPIVHGEWSDVHVGKFSSIANSVVFDAGMGHNHHFVTSYPLWRLGAAENHTGKTRGDTHVGNDVWIGDGALIMSGITIGNGAVIGARAVVTRDVSPYRIVVGAPARVSGWRLPWQYIEKMQEIAWWDWPEEKILANADLLLSDNWVQFIDKHTKRVE